MNSRHLRSIVAATAALGTVFAAAPAVAQKTAPKIEYVPRNSNPPVPAGLKVTCLTDPDQVQMSQTCPVVKYRGITTWAYSYLDNRVSMALVSYDKSNKVVANVEKRGARYVVKAISNLHNKTVMFVGQAKQSITVPWSELGAK
jgi:hypothetical protein